MRIPITHENTNEHIGTSDDPFELGITKYKSSK